MIQPALAATINEEIRSLPVLLPACMGRDQHRFRREIDRFSKLVEADHRPGGATLDLQVVAKDLTKLRTRMERSQQLADARRASVPAVAYPEQLPISARRQEILNRLRRHQVIIVAGETGSGKPRNCRKSVLKRAGVSVA